jgi:hypothetical protein
MLQTIEVEIDASGHIYPLEPLSFTPLGRAYLTLLPAVAASNTNQLASGSAAQALKLLTSPRFAKRPVADFNEVQQRINCLRNE